MNMLSSQIAELRELAADADVYGDTRNFRDPLEQAADTILELRDDLQRANAENAKLRELEGHMLRCMKRNSDCDYCLANGEHCEISHIEADALELGIEVPS